ncbi:MAG: hypothetical protein HY897_12060 [Deltaproteobacteria bacterium]|nr:hypothetical protein [Deltaproteobacteria bacterium]
MRQLLVGGLLIAAAAAVSAGCDEGNDCQIFLENLCSYASYKKDKEDSIAQARQDQCKCITDGAGAVEGEYQKLECTADIEEMAALDPEVDNDAEQLMVCRARNGMLEALKDDYITTCIQTDGNKDCEDALDGCQEDCEDTCKDDCDYTAENFDPDKCEECQQACGGECARKYPCNDMCG